MIQRIGVAAGFVVGLALLTAGWFAWQGVQATQRFLRTGEFVAFSKTEPLKVLEVECQDCSQSTIRSRFSSKAQTLEARYQAEQAGTLYLRFAAGTAQVGGKTLNAGCYEIPLKTGGRFEVSAKRVEIAFPRTQQTCSPATETS